MSWRHSGSSSAKRNSSPEIWAAVDQYIVDKLAPEDAELEAALRANDAAELPPIDVSPPQGKMLQLLARSVGARRILEIGTLGGYSTIWLARALPAGGKLLTLELEPKHAEVALANVGRAGLSGVVELRLGPALESLAALVGEKTAPFDFIFIDADKWNNAAYLDYAIRLARPGTMIIVDNVIRNGSVLDVSSKEPSVAGTRRFFDALAADARVEATALQTVGCKGYDGFALAVVR